MRSRALVGLALCTAILAAAYPLLLGLEEYPREVFVGEDAMSITAAAGGHLNDSFAAEVASESWAIVASPEVYAFSSWSGATVVVRGVDAEAFLEIEGGTLVSGSADGPFVLAGEGFASRERLAVGDAGVLTGSMARAIEPVVLTGVVRVPGPANDEVLIPLAKSRKLAGLAVDELSAIRLRVRDVAAAMADLEASGVPMAVTTAGGTTYLNADPGESRLTSLLFLYPELRKELGQSYLSAFAQQGVNGVRVVILALLAMVTLLAVTGIYAIVWRAAAEASRPVGILRALGAPPRSVVGSLAREVLPLGLPAVLIGLVAGYAVAVFAGAYGTLLLFAHAVRPDVDLVLAAEVLAIALGSTALSCVLAGSSLARRAPRDLVAETEPEAPQIVEEAFPL